MFKYYNPNPTGRSSVIDCAVRAVSKALDITWEEAYTELVVAGYQMADMPSSNNVIASVLRKHGFYKESLPDCKGCFTVSEFAKSNPIGTYVLGTNNHVVTIIDGDFYDAWNSSDESVITFWTK